MQNVRTLLVDDSDLFAESTTELLRQKEGLDVIYETCPSDALELLSKTMVDCVVSDYQMPGMNGIEFFEEVRARDEDVPFILLTAHGDEEIASKALSAGVDDYVLKVQLFESQEYTVLANRIWRAVEQHRTQKKYELLVSSTPDMLAQVDANGKIMAVNPAFSEFVDADADALVGRNITTVMPGETGEHRLEEGRTAIRSGSIQRGEDSAGGRNFSNIYIPVKLRSDQPAFQVQSRDVTERKRREEELDLLKQVFGRLLRHNVRNDAMVIKGHGEMLLDADNEWVRERAETIVRKGDLLAETSEKANTIKDIIDNSPERVVLDLSTTLDDAVEGVQSLNPDATITLSVPERLRVVAIRELNQAVRNLIENALIHAGETPQVDITGEQDGDEVVVTIEDDGPGINRSEIAVIKQGEETALDHASGVGLWVVERVVSHSEGELELMSSDSGTVARIRLGAAEHE